MIHNHEVAGSIPAPATKSISRPHHRSLLFCFDTRMKKWMIIILTLFMTLTSAAQSTFRRGPGCWRTADAKKQAAARHSSLRRAGATGYFGKKKGLVILAEFPDEKFKTGHDRAKYLDILNQPGYTTAEGFNGSVADYFRDQSNGLFELEFDVVGPYTTKRNFAYYGENDDNGIDKHPEEMIVEMCKAADAEVNFADYDWDGDFIVDEVFVVYAGKGETNGGSAKAIWPHMWTLTSAGQYLMLDQRLINVYACSDELMSNNNINGIGTFCHEFSHCLGLPDFYDVVNGGEFGMSDFDVMDQGCHAGSGFSPVCYTAYERMYCGWKNLITLGNEDLTVDSLTSTYDHGDAYILRNDAYPDEYYIIEYRQKKGWDSFLPSEGLMITHVDYDENVWDNNTPNSIYNSAVAREQGYTVTNDHQRMTIFHADNKDTYWTVATDLYPNRSNDSLTATSKPAATLYHKNSQGLKTMTGAILDIRKNSDGTLAFRYRAHPPVADAIRELEYIDTASPRIYTLDGRYVGTAFDALPRGIYIINGKRVIR